MSNRISYNEIRNISEDWTLDDRNNKPYSGRSVQTFLKNVLNGKAGDFYYDADSNKYIIFADAASRDLYLQDRETHADLVLGTFDAPANYTAEMYVTTPASNTVLAGATGNYIDFTFDVKSKTGSSTGEAVVATYTFNNAGNTKKITQIYSAGESVHFLVDPYLNEGVNSISVVITGRNTLVSTMSAITYTVVALDFTSTFDFSIPVSYGQYLSVPYSLKGAGVKYIEWYIDGVLQSEVDTITDLNVNRIKNIDTTEMSLGKHNVQARAYIANNGDNFYSNTLYYDFVVCPENEIWNSNVSYVLLNVVLDQPMNSTLSVNATQYGDFYCGIATYDSRSRQLDVTIKDNDAIVQSILTNPSEIESYTYSPTTTGVHTLSFNIDGDIATIAISVTSGDININEATDGLALKLTAKGRSNSESTPNTWTYENITTTFNNFTWNDQCGWNNGALVIPAGSSIDIDFSPLSGNPVSTGKTIEIDYEASNIEDESASILSLVNSSTNAGLSLTAASASLQSSGGANINTRYKDGDRVHLTFIINRTTGDNGRLIFIVNNGILERATSFAAADSFSASNSLHIGSTGCTIKLHSIRVYNRALSVDEAFCNYAVDSDNLLEIANNNDIINESTGLIDVDKVNSKIPVLIITGDIQPILDATDKNVTVYVDVEYRNMQDATKNFTATHLRMRPQGTSSLGYPRKNLRLYTSSKYDCVMQNADGEVLTDGLYAFKDNAQPVNCWTLKADYAESSGSHNTGVARIWNDLMYNAQIDGEFALRTEAQKTALTSEYNYDVRTTIDGFPIVVFQRRDINSELICLGQYNFNNDKSTEKVFGFTDIPGFNNEHVQCFEFLANEDPICLFDNVSNFDNGWSNAFESRYPDTKTPDLAPLKALATWINSCKDNQQKWNSEKADHFDLPKLAAYYVYLMRFGAVDQTVKNAMITTEDGQHWFFINYDNDTIIGIDNISTVLNSWDFDRDSIKPTGAYYYAGHNSVLWNCFEADAECMELVRTVDTALYSAGLTYANLVLMFDDEQCDKWCERIYNDNGDYKYIKPYKDSGAAVLYMLQGSRKSYRHWWLQHRMDMLDAKWATGAFRNRVVRFIAEGAPGGTFTVTSGQDSYYGYGINNVAQEIGVFVENGDTHNFTINQTLAIGDPVMIYNANNLSSIDLSNFTQYLSTLYINQAIGNNGESNIKHLILANGTDTNNRFTEIGGLNVITGLEEIDIRNFTAITNVELGLLSSLHTFKAAGSGLTSFAPANGSVLTEVTLPNTILSISMNGTNVSSLTYTPTTVLRSVSLRNVTGNWDAKTFVNTWLGLLNDTQLEQVELTLTGIDWSNMTVAQAIKIGKVGTKNLQGSITLSSMTKEEYEQLVDLFGANVFSGLGSFTINAPGGIYISGPTELVEGSTGTFTAAAFPASTANMLYLLYNGTTLIDAQTDSQNRVYRTYNGVTLYEATGVIEVSNSLSSDVSVNVRAHLEDTDIYSSYVQFVGKKVTYPSSVIVTGGASIDRNGTYNYTKSFDTNNYTATIQSVVWSLTSNNACSITASDDNSSTITVTNTPATALQVTLTCTVTFNGGVTRVGTKDITLQLTFPSSITITGDATLSDNGTYDYTKAFNTNNYTATLTGVTWNLTTNNAVVIKSSDNNTATLEIAEGNETQIIVTLTCIASFNGDVTVTGTKDITVEVIDPPVTDWVDLGLPSGLLWCTHNVGGTKETDYGAYFSWGNIEPHFPNGTTFSYNWGSSNTGPYASTPGASIPFTSQTMNADYSADSGYDAARELLGGSWRMPTATEFKELYDNTDNEWTTVNGVNGRKFMKKTDHSVYVFFPATGGAYNTLLANDGYYGSYPSSSLNSAEYKCSLHFDSSSVNPQSDSSRYGGSPVRAVKLVPKFVDLGLPSGLLWADRNVGAKKPEEFGLYFQWGDTEGHAEGSGYDFSQTNYNAKGLNNISANLALSQDAANAALGGSCRMPTEEETEELCNNTDYEWTTVNGMTGYKFMKKTDHSVYIFLPAAGRGVNTSFYNRNSGYYWSSSLQNANNGYSLYFISTEIYKQGGHDRPNGFPVRAVQ